MSFFSSLLFCSLPLMFGAADVESDLEVPPSKVRIEARIADVSDQCMAKVHEHLKIHPEWSHRFPKRAILSEVGARDLLTLIQQDSRTSVIGLPKIEAFNGKEKTIELTREKQLTTEAVPVGSPAGQQGQWLYSPQQTKWKVGFTFGFKPCVLPDQRWLTLRTKATFATLASESDVPQRPAIQQSIKSPFGFWRDTTFTQMLHQPTLTTLSIDSVQTIPNGKTLVLAGWKLQGEQQAESRLLYVSDLPFVGDSFKWKKIVPRTTNVLLILKATKVPAEDHSQESD